MELEQSRHHLKKSTEMIEVSIITPVYNGEVWLDECLQSVIDQTFEGPMELSIYNDSSTDRSVNVIQNWQQKLTDRDIKLTFNSNTVCEPKGVGFAKNRAIESSSGKYLCFLDVDDVMHKDRIKKQYERAREYRDDKVIVGCQFWREPPGSTERFTNWANCLMDKQLQTQAYTSHGPTLIMPTWFCSRTTFDDIGAFDESGKGTPEDLIFFYQHLDKGGKLVKVNEPLLMYRYHSGATTFSVTEHTIWNLRVEALQKNVISKWNTFTIWNAGKQGRQLYRSLSEENQRKVSMFCDVDSKKIAKGFYTHEESKARPKPKIPVVHFSEAKGPFIICVKQGLTKDEFEKNLNSLKLVEGSDFYHFN